MAERASDTTSLSRTLRASRGPHQSVQHDPTTAPRDHSSTALAGQSTIEPRTPEEIDVLMRRADVTPTKVAATGPLTAEPVLAVCARWPTGLIGISPTRARGVPSYDIHDSAGSRIGVAVRFEDRYKEVGYRYHYELYDTELRCVLRDVTPRSRLGISGLDAFSVLEADGAQLGTLTKQRPVLRARIPRSAGRRSSPRSVAQAPASVPP